MAFISAESLLTPPFTQKDVDITSREVLQQGFFHVEALTLRHRLFEGGWSPPMRRELHCRHGAVGVLLYDVALDSLVFIEQFRVGAIDDASPWKLEVVAGLTEDGESAEDVARREAREEAGCEIQELIKLHDYYPSAGACNERVTLLAALVDASQLGGVHGAVDENEDIRVHVVRFADAWELMAAGRLDNAMALIGMHWLAGKRASLRALPEHARRFGALTAAQ
ncbi:ADP-ribose diphosphatase [Halomonas cibimaris]|uniref:ADP-ribose pyrophosphatase n=1 Tax=Halomonas cibimaris TaxID=657012 RepID=A0ABP7LEV7_9GAMM